MNWRGWALATVLVLCFGVAALGVIAGAGDAWRFLRGGNGTSPQSGYRIVAYDARSGLWTVHRFGMWEGERQVRRLTLECDFYKWGHREAIHGSDACYVQVGRVFQSDWATGAKGDYVDDDGLYLSVQSGPEKDRVFQGFHIVKYELIDPAR